MRKGELTGRSIRDQIKATFTLDSLDPSYFSSHCLRKGATTHMTSQIEGIMRFEVARMTYDDSTAGHGPLSWGLPARCCGLQAISI